MVTAKKRVISNFISLASVQGLNFILPLITLPYLLQVVGPGKFGLISFAQAFVQYFILFTDYGFNLVATKEIALNREDKHKTAVIFSTVMLVRTILLIISFLILSLVILLVPKFQSDSLIYYLTFGMVVGNVMFPVWFFQGIEHMKIISVLNIIAKSIFTVGIFLMVKEESQFIYVPLLNSLGYITIGVISLLLIYYRYNIIFIRPSKNDIIHQLKEGWHIFVSNIVTSLYTTSNTFVLGFFVNNTILGYYSSAEKVIKALSSVVGPLIQAVYPFLSKALHESQEKAITILNKIFILITLLMGLLSFLIWAFAKPLVEVALGSNYDSTIPLLKILAPLPLILGWASVLGILTMINFNYQKQLSRIYIVASILSIILMLLLIPSYKEYGTAWNAVITEAFATLLMGIFLYKHGIQIWKWKK